MQNQRTHIEEPSNLGRLTVENFLRNLHGGEKWVGLEVFHSSFVPDSDQHRPNAHPVAIMSGWLCKEQQARCLYIPITVVGGPIRLQHLFVAKDLMGFC